jgi:hypothetical protein
MRKFSVLNLIEDVPSLADGAHYGKDVTARKAEKTLKRQEGLEGAARPGEGGAGLQPCISVSLSGWLQPLRYFIQFQLDRTEHKLLRQRH